MDDEQKVGQEGTGGEAQASPLAAVYPGERVELTGRSVWIRPWGVKALMTEVPAVLGRLMAKIAPLFEMVKGGALKPEDILQFLMQNSATELVEFVAWSATVRMDEAESLSAGDFLKLARAVVRQNRAFFDQLGGLYEDLGKEIVSATVATGLRSSSPSGTQGSPSTS